ncbi:MMPL family transporter [Geobacter sp. AOG2]|uniref:MMPL family transporter n=1 Tax=Geobacter sp. AOG2 TaxID=1566347 RepID=UPI001CC81611|nr:MMPL family transporter [Geobacter sp. AOG2]GFE61049.1 exporter [Geobacter sp. AOG2]
MFIPRTWFSRITAAGNALTRRHLEWIFRLTVRSPRVVIAASLILLALSLTVIATIRFEGDIFRLFPSRLPALRLLLDSLEWTGSAKEAYFLLEGEPRLLPVEAEKLSVRLKALRIDGSPAFSRITWRIYDENEGRLFSDFVAYAVTRPQLFVAPDDLPRLKERLSSASFDASLQRLETELAGQLGGAMTSLATADPLNIREFVLPRLKAGSQALDLDPASPYFLSRDGRVLILIAEPARPVQDIAFARRLVAGINEARKGLDARVTCAGAHISAVLDEAAMKSNIVACILSSLVVVLVIFYVVYRRLLPTLLLPLIISAGVVLALGTAGLFLPSIHIISFAFMALIIGLGTDYSIHLYDRYHGERAAGRVPDEALYLAIVDTGHGLFTAATTTALPFLALMISDVRALFELGLLVGLGVIYSFYATLFFLPPLLLFMEQRFPAPFRPLPGLGLRFVWRLAGRRPGLIASVSLLLLAALGSAAFSVRFDGELKNLQPQHSEAFLTQEKIEKHLSLAPRQLLVAVEGRDLGEVLARSGRVGELAERYRLAGRISDWSSLGKVINNRGEQQKIVTGLSTSNGSGMAAAFRAALLRHGFAPEPFQPFIDALTHFSNAELLPESEAVSRLEASPLRGVVNRHLIHDTNGYHSLIFIYYRGPEFSQTAFLKDLTAFDPAARASSVELVSSQLAASVSHSFLWSFLVGGLLVLFLLISHFRTKEGVFYPLFPVAGGAAAMLGVMALAGMKLNFMNAMVLVTIVGMGSDYGLHIGHRVGDSASPDAEARFVQAGRAVFLSALTTIAGFGSLAFADYPALASIGWATNLGVGFTAFFSLVTLPAAMFLKIPRKINK